MSHLFRLPARAASSGRWLGLVLVLVLAATMVLAPVSIAAKHKKHKAQCASLCPATFTKIVAKIDSEIAKVASSLTVAHAGTADNANALGGAAPSTYQKSLPFAVIEGNGTILNQSGGFSVLGSNGGAFTLNLPVPARAVTVSAAYTSLDFSLHLAQGEVCGGGTGLAPCNAGPNTTKQAFVETGNADGTEAAHAFVITELP